MTQPSPLESHLTTLGFKSIPTIHYGLTPAGHVEQAILNHEGMLSNDGALVVHTGQHTGRSPNDKYILQSDGTTDIWCGKINQPMLPEAYQYLYDSMLEHLGRHAIVYRRCQCRSGSRSSPGRPDDQLRKPGTAFSVRICLFPAQHGKSDLFNPDVTILHAPDIIIQPEKAGTHSSTFIVLNLNERMILIGGTAYAGEVKKSVFSLMNYLMPKRKVFPMHCSANVGAKGDVALFFGLSGTGKTTLSSSPDRQLIGDDEHGWSEQGVFNFEGGCYAKTIRLSPKYRTLDLAGHPSFRRPDRKCGDRSTDTVRSTSIRMRSPKTHGQLIRCISLRIITRKRLQVTRRMSSS